jgi:tyrosine-protein kinase Etk/Wzc
MSNGADDLLPVPAAIPDWHGTSGAHDLPPEEDEGGADLGRYLDALLRRKWLIVGLSVFGLAAGVGLSRIIEPVYEAQATIHIETTPRGQPQAASPIRTGQLFESRAWIELMRSFTVLDEVVRRQRLYLSLAEPADSVLFRDFAVDEPFTPGAYTLTAEPSGELALSTVDRRLIERVPAGDSVGLTLGFRWKPEALRPRQIVQFRVNPPRDAAVALGTQLDINLPPVDGALMRLAFRGTDARATAATVNTVAERFVEVAALLKREKLSAFTEVLDRQLASSYAELRAAERALEGFRVGTITLPSDRGATPIAAGLAETRDPVFGAFFQLKLDRDGLQNERDAILRALDAPADSGGSLVVSLGTIPAVRASTELAASLADLGERRAEARRLRLGFTSEHPPLRQLEREIEELERNTVRTQARELADNLSQRIADLDVRIAASSREMQQIPPRVSEEQRLARDRTIAQNLYTSLQEAFEQAKLAELSAAPDVRILDRAVPPTTPVKDQLLIVIAGGLVGGFGLGIVLALLLDRMDSRLRYPEQVSRLGIQILGALPLVTRDKQGRADPAADAQLMEALRSIRMSMLYSHGTAGPFITTITSPGTGEGKSFLSSKLAKAFADSGHRTLLIDADTRRGSLHRVLGGFRKPGLLDYLAGTASLEQVTQTIPDRGMDFIGCGTRKSAGPELLASTAMAQLLMGLRSKYTVILIDSPPLGAGVDPLILASLCGSMVLVLRNGVSDRELAEAKVNDLQRLPIRLLGAVLNDVRTTGPYQYYAYLPGYRAEDEVEAAAAVVPKAKRLLRRG